jgi:hypothetical protein
MQDSVGFAGGRSGVHRRQFEKMAFLLLQAKVFLVQETMFLYPMLKGVQLASRISSHLNLIRVSSRQISQLSHIHRAHQYLLRFGKDHLLFLPRR